MGFARSVKSPQRLIRTITAKITGATAVVAGTCSTNVKAVRAGAGIIDLTFEPYVRLPEVLVTMASDGLYAQVSTLANGSVRILTKTFAGVATDGNFHVKIEGSDAELQ